MSQVLLERPHGLSAHRLDVDRLLRWVRWAVICWVIVFWKLHWLSLLDPDEAHYAQLTHEMVRGHSWFLPLLDGAPYIDKPILFHWLQALSLSLFGETELALRLPSACAAVALFAVTRWVGSALLGQEAGEWGALMFATIPATFALAGIGMLDMVFTALLFGGVGVLLVAARHQRHHLQYLGFALVGLAVLTKGPVALLLIALFVAVVCLCAPAGRGELLALSWGKGVTGALVISVPWFAWMYLRFGAVFVTRYLFAGNLWYFTQPQHFSPRVVHHTFYLRTFVGAFFPWSVVALGRAIDVVRRRQARYSVSKGEAFLWAWVVVVMGFFSLARFKLDHYIFPAAPACCLLAARGWLGAVDDERSTATRSSIVALGCALIVGGATTAVALNRIDLGLTAGAVMLPVALVVGGAALVGQTMLRGWRPARSLTVPITMLLVVYATTVIVGFPALERTRPITFTARFLRTHSAATDPVGLYRLERWRASLRYYLGRRVERLEYPDDVRRFLASSQNAYVVMLQDQYDELHEAHVDVEFVSTRPAVSSTAGRGFRRQLWSHLAIVRSPRDPTSGSLSPALGSNSR